MNALIRVEVAKRKDAKLIEEALKKPDIRAFVLIVGIMDRLPSDRARARVLTFVNDCLTDPEMSPRRVTVETKP